MKKRSFVCVLICSLIIFTGIGTSAQKANLNSPELINKLKSRKFAVVVNSLSDKEIKKLSKNGEFDEKKKEIDSANKELVDIYTKFWSFNSEVVALTQEELDSLIGAGSTDYIYLVEEKETEVYNNRKSGHSNAKTYVYSYYLYSLKMTDNRKTICSVSTQNLDIKYLDKLSVLHMLEYTLSYMAEGKNKNDLVENLENQTESFSKTKSLLVTNHFTNISNIEKLNISPKEIKFVKDEEIVPLISSNDSNSLYAFVLAIPSTVGQRFRTIIFDCQTHKPVYAYNWNAFHKN